LRRRRPRVRAHPPGGEAERRPVPRPRRARRGGRGEGAAGPQPDQAAHRTRGGRRDGGLPVLSRGVLRQRRLPDRRRSMERELNDTDVPPEADPWAAQAQSVFLELLLRDAPSVEYERPLLEARARGDAAELL